MFLLGMMILETMTYVIGWNKIAQVDKIAKVRL